MEANKKLTELQLKHRQEMKEKRDALKQRKQRTHRLIVRGAIAEKVIPHAEEMSDEEFQQVLYQALDKDNLATCHPQDSVGRPLRENPSEDTS